MGRIVRKTATVTVDDDEDGLLGAVGDTAVVNVRDMSDVTLFVNREVDGTDGVAAELDLGTLAAGNLDTVVQAVVEGASGNAITVDIVYDDTNPAIVTEVGSAVTIHATTTVTTVADVEAAIAADATLISVKTAGTGATVLDSATDDFAATNLAGGDDEGTIAILVESSIDGTNYAELIILDETDFPSGNGKAAEYSLSDANGMAKSAMQLRVSIATLGETSVFSVTAVGTLRE